MVSKLTNLVVHRHRAVLIAVALLALIGGSSGMSLFDRLSAGGWDDPDAESGRAAERLEETFGRRPPNLVQVLLFMLTGSVLLPLLALVLSGLSLTATFGALVWIFQEGNLSDLLGGFTVTGNLAGTIPVMLFAIGFGLAMDYQVFMLSRIHARYGLRETTVEAPSRLRCGDLSGSWRPARPRASRILEQGTHHPGEGP
jgi:uncharacterized membrane protein YdfJ with MMPL/SSD domain